MFGIFGSKKKNIGMQEAMDSMKADSAIRLMDVRSRDEYAAGHIPGAFNLPLNELGRVSDALPDKAARIFVYCLSGGRSGMAVNAMKSAGYTDVHNIGGINSYFGPIER